MPPIVVGVTRLRGEDAAQLPAADDLAGQAVSHPLFTRAPRQLIDRADHVVMCSIVVGSRPTQIEVNRRADAAVLVREIFAAAERVGIREKQAVSESPIHLYLQSVVPGLVIVRARARVARSAERRELRTPVVAGAIYEARVGGNSDYLATLAPGVSCVLNWAGAELIR